MIPLLRQPAVLALGMTLSWASAGQAQPYAPPPPNRGAVDLNRMIHEMEQRVRHLSEDIASDMGRSPQGRHLLQDTRELAVSVEQMHQALHDQARPAQVRQAYASIDAAWHHLEGQFAQRGVSPAVNRAAQRVGQIDTQLHQALDMTGPVNLNGMVREMEQRVRHLSEDITSDMGRSPQGRTFARRLPGTGRLARPDGPGPEHVSRPGPGAPAVRGRRCGLAPPGVDVEAARCDAGRPAGGLARRAD